MNKPYGLEFEDSEQEQEELFSLPPIPEYTNRERNNEPKVPRVARIPADVANRISDLRNRPKNPRQAAGQPVPPTTKHIPKVITSSEASEIESDVETLLSGIFSLADSFREAYLKTHPKAKEGNGLFTLDDEELEQGTQWVLRRAKKSPKLAQRVRVTADLYDNFAVPVAIVFPRMKRFAKEIREQGVTLRGR